MSYDLIELKPYFKANVERHGIPTTVSGGGASCLCPFHEEKTASFYVHAEHGHCFGCGWHGDIISFEAQISGRHERADFVEIVTELSESLGVDAIERDGVKMLRNDKVLNRSNSQLNAKQEDSLSPEATASATALIQGVLVKHDDEGWRNQLRESSPVFTDDPAQEWRILLQGLFSLGSYIWLGSRFDSSPDNFHQVRDIVRLDKPSEQIPRPSDCFALGTFQKGAESRRREHLKGCDYILIECDELIGRKATTDEEREENKRLSASIIQWLQGYEDMTLRAVYDTGGKSLHSIWDKPSDDTVELLKLVCDSLGIDAQPLVNATAPLRMPRSKHEKTKESAKLLYLNPKYL